MGFKLRKNESASAGIRRIARELIDDSVGQIAEGKADTRETVHELRKQLKKLRALFRLVRGGVGDEVFDRDNTAARDLGRRLSAARDAAVRVSALDHLQKSFPEEFPSGETAALRRRLVARQRAALRRVRGGGNLAAVARELGELRLRVRAWPGL